MGLFFSDGPPVERLGRNDLAVDRLGGRIYIRGANGEAVDITGQVQGTSVLAAPSKVPLADANGQIDTAWLRPSQIVGNLALTKGRFCTPSKAVAWFTLLDEDFSVTDDLLLMNGATVVNGGRWVNGVEPVGTLADLKVKLSSFGRGISNAQTEFFVARVTVGVGTLTPLGGTSPSVYRCIAKTVMGVREITFSAYVRVVSGSVYTLNEVRIDGAAPAGEGMERRRIPSDNLWHHVSTRFSAAYDFLNIEAYATPNAVFEMALVALYKGAYYSQPHIGVVF